MLTFPLPPRPNLVPTPKSVREEGSSQNRSLPANQPNGMCSPCVRRGLRSYQKTLQVPELQNGIPKDLDKTPSLNHVEKISKTTKPKNLASMRSSRASDGLSALCQLIASWRTPSRRRHSASATMAVRSNTQSINQTINQAINPEAPPLPRPAAAALPPLHRWWHSFSTPPHLSCAATPICPVSNPDVAPAP